MKRSIFFLLLFAFSSPIFLFSQKTAIFNNPDLEYRNALELFNKEKFGAAQKSFNNAINLISDVQSEMRIKAEYYSAICAIQLFNGDAEQLLLQFARNHSESPEIKKVYFELGKFQYSKKEFEKAIVSFEKIDALDLTEDEKIEYYFKLGYANFMCKSTEKAKKSFYEIYEKESKYFVPANYYYGHIAYSEKNFETALKCFLKLTKDESFGPIVPYYITQIYYLQGNYDELLKVAPGLLDSANTKRAPEIARLIGEAYFNTYRFAQAAPYLELYQRRTKSVITRNDIYQLAFAYYMGADFKSAIQNFQNVDQLEDSLSQNAYFHLADCYLKSNQKQFAMNTFGLAEKMPFDKAIQEEALFNFAKLAYDLSYNPNNEAILAFQKYIKEYPNSTKIEEAYTCLVNLFLTTKNYKDALASIDNVKLKDDRLKEAYQKIAFYRGVELFNDGEFMSTLILFNKSLNQNFDKSIRVQTIYWKGEAYYRLLDYDSAKICYKEFLITPGAFSSPLFNMAQYNLGYCNFKKKNYADANIAFRKFVTNKKNEDVKIINDAYVRVGDCYFIGKDYASAIENYDAAIKIKAIDVDYAMLQKSLAAGALGKFDLKKETLLSLISNYPNSDFSADSKFELANTYQVQGNNEKALEYFSKIVKDYPASSYVKKSLLKTGLIYFNSEKNDQALVTFKKIVADFPGTNESKEALLSIQNIYIELDKVEDFFAYVKTLPFANVSNADQDSITYIAVENRYMSGDCENSIKGFSNYIEKFPKGAFIVNANFYKAECDFNNNNLQVALAEYEFVSRSANSKFLESALVKAAAINLKLKNYKDALQQFIKIEEIAEFKSNILDAIIGQMRCNVLLNNNIQTLASSRKLLGVEKVSEDLKSECHLNIAKAALAMDSLALAQTEFELTTKLTKNEAAAEAKYNLALIQFKQSNYAESQKLIFESINQVPSYDFWIAKCFLLLSDNYVKTGNVFQAKHTLQSIIDNYEGADLVKEAHEKLNVIVEAQKLEEQKKAQDDMNNKFPKDKNNEDSNEIK